MPTERVRVFRLDATPAAKGLTQWLVTATYADGRLGAFQATTASPFAASLCDQYRKDGHELLIQWRDVPEGKRITLVEPATETTDVA